MSLRRDLAAHRRSQGQRAAATGGVAVSVNPSTQSAVSQGAGSTSATPWYVISTAVGGAGSTTVDAILSSAGSTRTVGRVTVENPTTAVTVSNPTTSVTAGQGAGSTSVAPWYVISTAAAGAGSTAVDATLSSAGSTRLAGRFTVDNPTTAVTVSNPTTAVTVSNPTTSVSLSSQHTFTQGAGSTTIAPWYVISTGLGVGGSTAVDATLTSAGSTRLVGQVTVANPTTAVNVVQGAGSTSVAPWYVISTAGGGAGSTSVDASLTSAGSTKLVGLVDGVSFSSAGAAFTTVNSSVDAALLAADATRRGCIIQNASTGTALLVRLSTQAVSSASAYQFQVPANGFVAMGGQVGNLPNFTGPMRCKMNSTAVAGPVHVTAFT